MEKGIYQDVTNFYRRNFCNGKSRPLLDGEFHPLCANFEGPGTKISLPEVRNFPPYNGVDSVAKQHDLDYFEAFKLPVGDPERERLIEKPIIDFLRGLRDSEKKNHIIV